MEKKLQIKEKIFDEELKKVKSNSLKTEIALRSKQEEIRNQLEKTKQFRGESVTDENCFSETNGHKINPVKNADVGLLHEREDHSGDAKRASLVEKFNNANKSANAVDSPMKMLFEKARKKSISGRNKFNV